MLDNLNKYRILLASKSPRRRELLSQLRVPFNDVSIGGVKEEYPDSLTPHEVPLYLSRLKANAYRKHLNEGELVITADTVVINQDKILGKPKDREDAKKMLAALAGKIHEVVTGVTLMTTERTESFKAVTEVKFAGLTEEEIVYYLDNYHPYDKAGSYGIQEWIGCVAVESINGSYYNVMGLPVHRLYNALKRF